MPGDLNNVEEELTLDNVISGDRPSIVALGLAASQALKLNQMAVFMVDVKGRVRLMPNEAVKVLAAPKLSDEELDEMQEQDAIEALVAQAETEQVILDYIARRKAKQA